MATEPTILIRKADGTTERVPVSSVLKNSASAETTSAPVVAPKKDKDDAIPVKMQSVVRNIPTKIAPILKPINNLPNAANQNEEEAIDNSDLHESLLSEPALGVVGQQKSYGDNTQLNQADEIIKRLSFTVPEDLHNRLRSLIQLALKDVRTQDQTRGAALRPVNQGGLGLSIIETEELIAKMNPGKANLTNAGKIPVNFVARINEAMPPAKAVEINLEPEKKFRIANINNSKVMVHDITARDAEVSPIDEIRLFTVTDFRRLSTNPAEAASRLKQKFINLRSDSVLFYFDGLEAWRQSSLYNDYITNLAVSVDKKMPFGTETPGVNLLKADEMTALATLSQDLIS